jgi:hypothetical protein
METLKLESCQSILKAGQTTTERALELFDALDPVSLKNLSILRMSTPCYF